MAINQSGSREQFIRSLVQGSRFTSEDAVIDEALNLLKQKEQHRHPVSPSMGSIGAMREDAEFLDQVVESAMTAPPAALEASCRRVKLYSTSTRKSSRPSILPSFRMPPLTGKPTACLQSPSSR